MIHDPPLLTVRKEFARAADADVRKLAGIETGWLADAMNGRGALDRAIKPIDPAKSAFVGVALPCICGPNDNLAILAAVALAKPGDVVMAAAEGFAVSAIIGDNVAGMAKNAKCAALVTDGMVRDTPGIKSVGLPMFSAGVTPNSCVKSGPGSVGLRAVVGGVVVEPGDVVAGDVDGVVVIPRAQLGAVLAFIEQIRVNEKGSQARVAAGATTTPYIEQLLKSDKVKYVD
jgi:4-hydroxy-4-methyl-2-oxoglutarate aldolase